MLFKAEMGTTNELIDLAVSHKMGSRESLERVAKKSKSALLAQMNAHVAAHPEKFKKPVLTAPTHLDDATTRDADSEREDLTEETTVLGSQEMLAFEVSGIVSNTSNCKTFNRQSPDGSWNRYASLRVQNIPAMRRNKYGEDKRAEKTLYISVLMPTVMDPQTKVKRQMNADEFIDDYLDRRGFFHQGPDDKRVPCAVTFCVHKDEGERFTNFVCDSFYIREDGLSAVDPIHEMYVGANNWSN